MFSKVNSAYVTGIDGLLVEVEVDVGSLGLPSFAVVGLGEGAVKESRDRVKSALKNIGFNIFAKPITVNLAPADFKKDGTHFDLPIAVGLVAAGADVTLETDDMLFAGELSLDGRIRGVNGILPIAGCAKANGIKKLIVPKENMDEAAIIDGVEVYGFDHFGDLIEFLRGLDHHKPHEVNLNSLFNSNTKKYPDFADVKGQMVARRAAEIASAGMHNIIMVGTPGSGKTMIARRIPGVLPEMTLEEAIETTKIHSVAGLIKNKNDLASIRPFISPHHTSSNVAIIGGTSKAMPGHVSIANNGVLFLDEMLEFNRDVLETLRQPLEDREVTIARAGRTVVYPANFMLIAASNPCPCGYLGDNVKECTCSQGQIQKYRSRLSGPLMDRIDIQVDVPSINITELSGLKEGEDSETMRGRVKQAHDIQKKRFAGTGMIFNSNMGEPELKKYCALDGKTAKILESACMKFGLSARAYSKIIKVSRTIADLDFSENIQSKHLLEALQYRMLDRDV